MHYSTYSSEIDEMTVSPSDGPMVQVNWTIIGAVAATVTVLVVGSVTAAAALIAWRVRKSGQGGERSAGKIMFSAHQYLYVLLI